MSKNTIIWLLYSVVIVYNLLDAYHTWLLMQYGITEWNPILRPLIEQFGYWPGVMGVKGVVLVMLLIILKKVMATLWTCGI